MSEARAVTNFAGNAIATLLVATWTKELDREQLDAVLAGDRPFDEATMLDEDGHGGGSSDDTLADLETTPTGRPDAGPDQHDVALTPGR
jgi:aerobic C4-dicarboxylate transport protein